MKNKVAPPFKQAEFDIMYGKGISREGGLIDVGVEAGLVRKSGAWYTYDGDQLGQGKENARTVPARTTPTWPTSWRRRSSRSSASARRSTPRPPRSRPCLTSPSVSMTSELAKPRQRVETSRWRGDVAAGVTAWVGERPEAPPAQQAPGHAPPPDDRAAGPDADPESVARKILLDQLTGRARSRAELRAKLAAATCRRRRSPTRLLDRFTEVGLIDDAAFARSWVESRQAGKGLAPRALAQELRRKGVDDEVAKEALDDRRRGGPARGGPAAGPAQSCRSLRAVDTATATRRLVGMLARKGYSSGLAFAVVRAELADRDDAALLEGPT